ncbi:MULTISPECIES: hypothetical protein [Cupriavidus]
MTPSYKKRKQMQKAAEAAFFVLLCDLLGSRPPKGDLENHPFPTAEIILF